eukprot:TRINITY_DN911_c0_g1_i4.p1 TRINITY_DN911_c0_g1~~TRINITY_DN911_c0_g1_i4.p1  ORF type:complete len:548 (-),score=115.00 TRINITY_DN911_c0_g1_i4:220-1863(-)
MAGKWAMMTSGEAKSGESSFSLSDCAANSRICPFDPAALPFDYRTHASVEIQPSDQLFSVVMAYLVREGVILDEDAISFQMGRAEKGGSKKASGCCGSAGGACAERTCDAESLKAISVSLGIGLFRFVHKDIEFKALHQQVGDPVGTGCGAQVMSNLVLFKEGTGPTAMRAIQAFLAEVLSESEKTAKNTFQVYRWHIKYQFWQRVSRVVARPISSVVLPEKTSKDLVDDVSEFLSEETGQFYVEHGIPYKRSYLFYGVPGAGKTSMIQALAGKFGRNLCYLSPTHPELSDDNLKSAIEKVPDNAIVVLEDVDALFGKNREKKVQQSPLTFSGLLNALDGVGNHAGLIFVLTTNFKEQLDAALIRDGRVDYRVRFDYCTPEQMERMFYNFYPQCKTQAAETVEAAVDADADPEIAALEAKLAALRKAKAVKDETDSIAVPSGAAFRDALLLSLGDRVVSTAQLQHFFVTHRKCSPAEAIADVGAIAATIDERAKEENEQKADKETDGGANQDVVTKTEGAKVQHASSKVGENGGKTIHVHVHSAEKA